MKRNPHTKTISILGAISNAVIIRMKCKWLLSVYIRELYHIIIKNIIRYLLHVFQSEHL